MIRVKTNITVSVILFVAVFWNGDRYHQCDRRVPQAAETEGPVYSMSPGTCYHHLYSWNTYGDSGNIIMDYQTISKYRMSCNIEWNAKQTEEPLLRKSLKDMKHIYVSI